MLTKIELKNIKDLIRLKYKNVIDCIHFEDNNDLWLYLNKGFINPFTDCHSIHENKFERICEQLERIEKCDCNDCRTN